MHSCSQCQENHRQLIEINERLRVLEANQAPPESDSTACSPAGCGHLEQVTAGRSPDRESFAEVLSKVEYEFAIYLSGVPETGISKAAVTYIKDKVLQHLHRWNRA